MNRIKELRAERGMKQEALARLLNCTRTAISHYETGYRDIDSGLICRLCDIFGCSSDYLIGRTEEPRPIISEEDARLIRAYHSAGMKDKSIVCTALNLPQPEAESAEEGQAV